MVIRQQNRRIRNQNEIENEIANLEMSSTTYLSKDEIRNPKARLKENKPDLSEVTHDRVFKMIQDITGKNLAKDFMTCSLYDLIDYFKYFDKDLSGELDQDEMQLMGKKLGISEYLMRQMIKEIDQNGDGQISEEEWVKQVMETRQKNSKNQEGKSNILLDIMNDKLGSNMQGKEGQKFNVNIHDDQVLNELEVKKAVEIAKNKHKETMNQSHKATKVQNKASVNYRFSVNENEQNYDEKSNNIKTLNDQLIKKLEIYHEADLLNANFSIPKSGYVSDASSNSQTGTPNGSKLFNRKSNIILKKPSQHFDESRVKIRKHDSVMYNEDTFEELESYFENIESEERKNKITSHISGKHEFKKQQFDSSKVFAEEQDEIIQDNSKRLKDIKGQTNLRKSFKGPKKSIFTSIANSMFNNRIEPKDVTGN